MLQSPGDFTFQSCLNRQQLESDAGNAWQEVHAISRVYAGKQQSPQVADDGHHAIYGRQRRGIAGTWTTTLLFNQQGGNLVQCPRLSSDFALGGVSFRIQESGIARGQLI